MKISGRFTAGASRQMRGTWRPFGIRVGRRRFRGRGGRADAERLELLLAGIRLHHAADSSGWAGTTSGEPSNAVEIFIALGETIRSLSLPVRLFEDLLSAFRQDVTVKRYGTWDHVMDYCRRSANPVGRLVLRIAGYHDARLDGWSDAMCAALQLTNFWQDVKVDFDKGRIYLPADERERYGAIEADLAAGRMTPGWRRRRDGSARATAFRRGTRDL
jgi:phytoene/squalene synthetase